MRRNLAAVLCLLVCACAGNEEPKTAPPPPPPPASPEFRPEANLDFMASTSDTTSSTGETCQTSLWKHVYHGTFSTAKDRLKVLEPCTTITGKIVKALPEKDGDYHIRIKLDAEFASMLNPVNKQSLKHGGQGGYFVVEPMCANTVTQPDTVAEKVCTDFKQTLYDAKTMKDKRVRVTGAFVTDMDHGWNEIHPVSRMTVIQP
jgi:hypothetical protein